MTEAAFIEKNSTDWSMLENALHNPIRSFVEVENLMRLYRLVSGHYGYAQTYFGGSSLCEYLGKLTAEAHSAVYENNGKRNISTFFSQTLPSQLYRNRAFIIAAAGIFLLAAILSFAIILAQPAYAAAFLPSEYSNVDVESSESGNWSPAIMSNSIMVQNIKVSVMAFGLGLTCGIGTLYVVAYNGAMLGAMAALFTAARKSLFFWSLILPHGVWELAAIFIAGGAGLRIGYSLIRPGVYRRADSLLHVARSSLVLLAPVGILLVLAAFIEGYFTPSSLIPELKLIFAAGTAILLALSLIWIKRVTRASA
ncbi:MAG: stage II sporulation protein M [Eubacteriaceae bacterium]|nr:stage II sporulation protein M [Eubacteriaceae bacterium]